MKITYSINKYYPDVQYLATYDPLPMATTEPLLTETKVTKKRLDRKGITVVENKELEIGILKLFWYLLIGLTLRQVVEKVHKEKYIFNISITR